MAQDAAVGVTPEVGRAVAQQVNAGAPLSASAVQQSIRQCIVLGVYANALH